MAGRRALGRLLAAGVALSGALFAAPAAVAAPVASPAQVVASVAPAAQAVPGALSAPVAEAASVALSAEAVSAARAAAQDATPPAKVLVPGQPMDVSLHLAGASGSGVAVLQGTDPGDWLDGQNAVVYTGAEGGELAARPAIEAGSYYDVQPMLLGVHGNQLGWAEPIEGNSEARAWYLHRMELQSGSDVIDAPTAEPTAFTGDSWYTAAALTSDERPKLLRHIAGSGVTGKNGEMNIVKLLDQAQGVVDVDADFGSALVAVADPPLPGPGEPDSAEEGTRRFQLLLIDANTGAAQTLVDSTDVITSVALGPDLIAWDSQTGDQALRINSRTRGDVPAVSSYTETDADTVELVANEAGVGYLVTGPVEGDTFPAPPAKDAQLRVVSGNSATTTKLPDYSSGLAAVGDRFLTATGGSKKVAGVYSVSPGDAAVRTATVPRATRSVRDVALAGSALYTYDRSPSADSRHSVWKTAISGRDELKAGATKRYRVNGIALEPELLGRADREMAFSAGRALIRGPEGDLAWQLADRGKITGAIEGQSEWTDLHPVISGPYALVDTTVFKPNGDKVYQVRNSQYFGGRAALFGSTIVYSLDPGYDEETGAYAGRIWVDDVEKPDPQVLATYEDCWQPPRVAVWAGLAAWTSSCGSSSITVRDLVTGQERLVENPFAGGYPITDLQLSEGVLFWANDVQNQDEQYGGHVLDLNTADAQRVDLLGDWRTADLDDHLIARTLPGRGGAEVQRLPFAGQYPPRLIGKLVSARFTAGTAQWRPKFDLTKPIVDVRLVLSDGTGATVRTLTGTAPDSSVRDIGWDGRDQIGRKVAPGAYHWRLLGQAADGDGTLIGKRGGAAVSGQVRVLG